MAVAKKAIPFMIAFLLALLLITYVPWLSTVLL
jgi:C4-dicarboxylate transporter DctM subunit